MWTSRVVFEKETLIINEYQSQYAAHRSSAYESGLLLAYTDPETDMHSQATDKNGFLHNTQGRFSEESHWDILQLYFTET